MALSAPGAAPRYQPQLDPSTLVVSLGRPDRQQGAPVNPPLVLSSTYASAGTVEPGEMFYARADTEAWHGPEQVIGALEEAPQPAVLFASGMAAIAAVFGLLEIGRPVIMPVGAYQVASQYARYLAAKGLIALTEVDIADTGEVITALDEVDQATGPGLLWIESPTNPLLQVADIHGLVEAAHFRGWSVAVDNTFATPLGQRPLKLGADLVIHSVTKYLSGHSDVVLGAVAAAQNEVDAALRQQRTIAGAIPGPFESWLALRGMRTLALRIERSQGTAAYLAGRLAADQRVERVRYPGLPGDLSLNRASRQMTGFGSILTLELPGGATTADAMVEAVRLWLPATSLGGVESSLERRRRFPTESTTVPEGLIRLSTGIENPHDLWVDLDQAINQALRA